MWLRHAPAPLLWIHPVAKKHIFAPNDTKMHFFALGQYRIILSADTASEVRQMLSQKRR